MYGINLKEVHPVLDLRWGYDILNLSQVRIIEC